MIREHCACVLPASIQLVEFVPQAAELVYKVRRVVTESGENIINVYNDDPYIILGTSEIEDNSLTVRNIIAKLGQCDQEREVVTDSMIHIRHRSVLQDTFPLCPVYLVTVKQPLFVRLFRVRIPFRYEL